jgi:hypothetical protein
LLARCNGAEAFDERLKPERIASWEVVEGAGGRHPSDAVEDPWQAHAAIRELLALGSSETNPLKVAEHAAASARRDLHRAFSHFEARNVDEAIPGRH